MKRDDKKVSDVEECRVKIQQLLKEYNCDLMDSEEDRSWILIIDNDTDETLNMKG